MNVLDMSMVEPTIRTLATKFKFNCYKGIKCFNRCCGQADIILTPYDVLRMKKRLKISSGEFLKNYVYISIDEKSLHPYAMIKTMDGSRKRCPFVTPEGCFVYADRPASCRYYPIGQVTAMSRQSGGEAVGEESYFFITDPNCLGSQGGKEWTIETWRIDQGVDFYDDMNREWKEIQLRRDVPGHSLDDKKQAMMYMASYDLDRFKKYVFESTLLDLFEIDKDEIQKIRTDEVSLMKFGFRYLKYILMLKETLKTKQN